MKFTVGALLLVLVATLLPACGKWSWPPFEKSVRELFVENRERFEEVRQNMVADDLEFVDSAHARGVASYTCEGSGCPSTIKKNDKPLQLKYSNMIEEQSIFRYYLGDGVYKVELSLPSTQGGDFFFEFVQSEPESSIPHCDENKARLPTCGACYEDLNPNWHMYWKWFPQDLAPDWDGRIGEGLPTPEEVREQFEIALDDCLKAGRAQMNENSGAN